MSIVSGQTVAKLFTVAHAAGPVNFDSAPTGTLFVNGVSNAATVTITNVATGRYKAAVTLPTLVSYDIAQIIITGVIDGITSDTSIWDDVHDGGGTATVAPVVATATSTFYAEENLPSIAQASAVSVVFVCLDSDDVAINLSGKTVRFIVTRTPESDAAVVFYRETGGSGVTVSGADSNNVTVAITTTNTASALRGWYHLWNTTDSILLSRGAISIDPAKKTST